MSLLWLYLWATASAAPSWSDLAPWHTWLLLEDAEPMRDWFYMAHAPAGDQDCVVALQAHESTPYVRCEKPLVSVFEASPGKPAPSVRKKARAALASHLGIPASQIDPSELRWAGRYTHVKLRQVLVMKPADQAIASPSRVVEQTWKVFEDGRVRAPSEPDFADIAPLCRIGLDRDCDGRPFVLAYQAPEAFEAQFYLGGDFPDPAWLASFESALKQAIAGKRLDILPQVRDPAKLPPTLEDHVIFHLYLEASGPEGVSGGLLRIDRPLIDAVLGIGGISAKLDEDGTTLVFDPVLGDHKLTVSLRRPGEPPVEKRYTVLCPLVLDDERVALAGVCEIEEAGAWLHWEGEGGAHLLIQLMPKATPRMGIPQDQTTLSWVTPP